MFVNNLPLSKRHFLFSLLAFLLFLVLSLPFLSQLEFLRHTEADRTLIAWEMLRTKAWFAPTLFGDLYLTKPPLYYWVLAAVFSLFGDVSEGLARLPSAVSAGVLASTFFFFLAHHSLLAQHGRNIRLASLGAFVLYTSAEFFRYGGKAEMDMFYSCLCGLALFFSYTASTAERWILPSLFAGTCVGLAFLAKGPPILVFYAGGLFGLLMLNIQQISLAAHVKRVSALVLRHLLSLIIPLFLVSAWILAMRDSAIRSEDLAYQLQEELFRRFLDDSEGSGGGKAWWYYLVHFPAALLPWSMFFLPLLFSRKKTWKTISATWPASLCAYSLGVLLFSLFVFSLSSGKSTRYVLPIFPFAVLILLPLIEDWGKRFLQKFSFTKKLSWLHCVIIGALIVLSIRLIVSYAYAPYAHATRSAKPWAIFLKKELEPKEPLYVLEVFERWLPYYFIKNGGEVFRITPALTKSWENSSERIHLLINKAEESWRIDQLVASFPQAVLQKTEFSIYKHRYVLLQIPASSALAFHPKSVFPTAPSKIPANFNHQDS